MSVQKQERTRTFGTRIVIVQAGHDTQSKLISIRSDKLEEMLSKLGVDKHGRRYPFPIEHSRKRKDDA